MSAVNKPSVLILESNDWDREQVRSLLDRVSRKVHVVNPRDLDADATRVDVIIFGISDAVSLETGRAQLERARRRFPQAQLIVCAPRNTDDLDSRILQLKARAFLLKPIDPDTFTTLLNETLAQIHLRHERAEYARSTKRSSNIDAIIGKSEEIQHVLRLLERVAQSASTSVLLLGESGVGKSLFAQTVHELCPQSHGPFIEINCATLPTQLLESELFGYEAGAFTDARSQKTGLIELADGGTLFLDEITEVDLQTQAKLLKFLDTKRFRRLGGDVEISVDVRIVAASNRDLKHEVREGHFREDLFYRLNVVEIHIPPLRERREDIDMIATYYFDYYRKKFNKPKLQLSDSARSLIREYPWPGNVRELINVLERAVLLTTDTVVDADAMPIQRSSPPQRFSVAHRDMELVIDLPPAGVPLEQVERAVITETLKKTHGNVLKASRLLGVSRGALRNKLSKYDIEPRQFAKGKYVTEPVEA